MGFIGKAINKVLPSSKAAQECVLPLADCRLEDCEGCTDAKYPASLKIEADLELWNSAKPFAVQVLVYTGKTDWVHNVADIKHSLMEAMDPVLSSLQNETGSPIRLNACSLASEPGQDDTCALLLPYFVTLHTSLANGAADLAATVQGFQARIGPAQINLSAGSRLQPSPNRGYIVLCSHRTRDKRCGVTAPILKKEFEIELREHELYRDHDDARPGGVSVVLASHVGGHKFAANVIIYLRTGEVIWLARITPAHVRAVVEHCLLKGEVFAEHLRTAFQTNYVTW